MKTNDVSKLANSASQNVMHFAEVHPLIPVYSILVCLKCSRKLDHRVGHVFRFPKLTFLVDSYGIVLLHTFLIS